MVHNHVATNPSSDGLHSLSVDVIDGSPEIQNWVAQFDPTDHALAAQMVRRLRFVPSSTFEHWLQQTMVAEALKGHTAVFSVDRTPDDKRPYWNVDGAVSDRSGGSHGSEDLVYSLISKLGPITSGIDDHPSIEAMRKRRTRRILLLDDSIGSGKKAAGFLRRFMSHASLKSWWSAGFIHVTVASFARERSVERHVLAKMPGSGSRSRRNQSPQSHATLRAQLVVNSGNLVSRWGPKADDVVTLCQQQKGVFKNRRCGFGKTMANVVFEHSVPNNLPGVFWFTSSSWKPLFPDRRLPDWMLRLLKTHKTSTGTSSKTPEPLSPTMFGLITAVGRGVRTPLGLAFAIESDTDYAAGLLQRAIELGLVTSNGRLTDTGQRHQRQHARQHPEWNNTLYIPTSWRVGP